MLRLVRVAALRFWQKRKCTICAVLQRAFFALFPTPALTLSKLQRNTCTETCTETCTGHYIIFYSTSNNLITKRGLKVCGPRTWSPRPSDLVSAAPGLGVRGPRTFCTKTAYCFLVLRLKFLKCRPYANRACLAERYAGSSAGNGEGKGEGKGVGNGEGNGEGKGVGNGEGNGAGNGAGKSA